MTRTKRIAALVTVVFLSASCGTMAQPDRPKYTGADRVGAIDASRMVGSWSVRALNPIQGEQVQGQVTYSPDGTFVGVADNESSGMTMKMQTMGKWSVHGDKVMLEVTDAKEISGNKMAAMMMPMMKSIAGKQAGSADVYELSATRMVTVSEQSGLAQEFTRLR